MERPIGYINKWPLYSGPCPLCCPSLKKEPGKCPGTSRCPTGWPLSLQRTWLISIQSLSGDLEQQRIHARYLYNPNAHKLQVFFLLFFFSVCANTHWNRPGLRIAVKGCLFKHRSSYFQDGAEALRTATMLARGFDCSHGRTWLFF